MTRRQVYRAAASAIALISLAAIGASRLDRPLTDYLLFDYTRMKSMHDAAAGKFVELGASANFGSLAYEVAVYDAPGESGYWFGRRKPVIAIVSPGHEVALEFDGKCYFLRSALRKKRDRIEPFWRDEVSGKEICFYVLTPDGTKVTRTDDIPRTLWELDG